LACVAVAVIGWGAEATGCGNATDANVFINCK